MEQKTESATEWCILLYEHVRSLSPMQERAIAARSLGELTLKQSDVVDILFSQSYDHEYDVAIIPRRNDTWLNWLLAKDSVPTRGKKALDLCISVANWVRDQDGHGDKNIAIDMVYQPEKSIAISPATESAPTDSKPKPRRPQQVRVATIKKAVRDYWVKIMNGELVKRETVALKKGLEKNILSKEKAEPYMQKISEKVELVAAKHGGIKNIPPNDKAALLAFIYDITK